ncbi:hypothetical protein L1987_78353 [Smallanthus sonchifolius]|uniref:Uncharacterized protein n=1 Tax=Smallanthus sonchifolius TaxID=185202 RepID=A0ACB8ZC52_9ASTR|nr:hypothetical protein L1987_78353 [Smallanthus sonchifolius]
MGNHLLNHIVDVFLKIRTVSFVPPVACKNAPESSEEKRVVDLLIATTLNSSGFTVAWYLQRESLGPLIGKLGLPLYCSSDVNSMLYKVTRF